MKIYVNSLTSPRKPFFNDIATTYSLQNRISKNLTISWYWYLHGIIDIYEFTEFRIGVLESYTYDQDKFDPFDKNNLPL